MPHPHSPTARGRRLARELRQLRIDSGHTAGQIASQLGWSRHKLSRIEDTRTKPSKQDLELLLSIYDVSPQQRGTLRALYEGSWRRGWWTATTYRDVFSGSFVALEDEATKIQTWAPLLVPGLLQTDQYALAVMAYRPLSDEQIQRRVAARAVRRALLSRVDAPDLHVVLDEAAIRRPLGGRETMASQLRHLVQMAELPNVTIQVLPFSAGGHPGLEGAFTIFTFGEADPEVAYSEGPAGDAYLDAAKDVERLRIDLQRLRNVALSTRESKELLLQITGEYANGLAKVLAQRPGK